MRKRAGFITGAIRQATLGTALWVGATDADAAPPGATAPQFHWELVHPYPSGHELRSAAWGPPGCVVVGGDREVLFSEDAQQWARVAVGLPKEWWSTSAVCYYHGKYVLAGGGGRILWSGDGRDWQQTQTPTGEWLRVCAGGNGAYVVLGENRTLLVSTNAQDWDLRHSPVAFVAIAFGNSGWVAVGDGGLYVSADLLDWTQVSVTPSWGPYLRSICFGQGTFVVGGAGRPDDPGGSSYGTVLLYSTNAYTWHSASLEGLDAFGEIRDCAYANGHFVAVQAASLMISPDGATWEKIAGPPGAGALAAVTSSPAGGFLVAGASGTLLTSEDARTWRLVTSGPREEIHALAYAAGRFVAVGGSPWYIGRAPGSAAVLTSFNGYDWQPSLTHLENQLSAVAYGDGRWVVCGDDGGIYTSSDAVNWTDHSLPPTTHDLHLLVYGQGRFVAFAEGRDLVYHSTNGVDWLSAATPLASHVQQARFLHGHFMAVGGNEVLSSPDGLSWGSTSVPAAGSLNTLTYGNGRYVAGGYFLTAHSLDGVSWAMRPAPAQLYDLQFMAGWFVAIGNAYGVLVSRDGIEWEEIDDPALTDFALNALACSDGVLVAGGFPSLYRGILFDPAAGPAAPVLSQRPRSLVIPAGSGATFTVGALGSPPPQYQWRFNGQVILGETNPSLSIPNAQATNAGAYVVSVRNDYGDLTSDVATLAVREAVPPRIMTQPGRQTVGSGATAVYRVVAVGDPPLRYQWLFNGAAIEGAVDPDFEIIKVQPTDAGDYAVSINGPSGFLVSEVVSLAVNSLPPPGLRLAEPQRVKNVFSVTVTTVAGRECVLEYKDALTDPVWIARPPLRGDGTAQILDDHEAYAGQRFYRLRQL